MALPDDLTPTAKASATRLSILLAGAEAVVIEDDDTYQLVSQQGQDVAALKKALEEDRLQITRPMDEAKRQVMARYAPHLDKAERILTLLREKLGAYQQRRRREREEAERKARDEAAKRDREQREAEQRQRDEADRKAREIREAADRERAERERAIQDAAKAGDFGTVSELAADLDQAEQRVEAQVAEIQREPVQQEFIPREQPVAPYVPPAPKVKGVSTRTNWKAECTSLRDLVIAAGKAAERGDDTLLAYLQANAVAMSGVARSTKGAVKIPGVRIWDEASMAFGSR